MVWPGKETIELITRNIETIVAPRFLINGFKPDYEIIENRFEWRFRKREEGDIQDITFRLPFSNSISVEFWVNRMSLDNSATICKILPDSPFLAEVRGFNFVNEDELKLLLGQFVIAIEEKGFILLNEMMKCGERMETC